MITREWSAIHRKHHAKCETVDDPHSPVTRGIKKVLLEGSELYRAESKNRETVEKYGHGAPDDWIERNVYSKHTMAGIYLTLAVCVLLFGFAGLIVFAIQMIWIPINAAGIINGIGHFWGYRNFDAPDQSRNIGPLGIMIGGEELHNNHHAFATSAKFSSRWYEFDIGWMYIQILSFFGLATVRKVAPTPKFTSARPQVDLEALQAVIHHRYDLMAAYARSIRAECKKENLSKLARQWLHVEDQKWPEAHKAKLAAMVENNERVQQLIRMRQELSVVWERSSQSREQLVSQLQAWCQRAEASGIASLEALSRRVRSYAV
jgi:stearoyl-CoA desaturase (Delta-9 desaturase)